MSKEKNPKEQLPMEALVELMKQIVCPVHNPVNVINVNILHTDDGIKIDTLEDIEKVYAIIIADALFYVRSNEEHFTALFNDIAKRNGLNEEDALDINEICYYLHKLANLFASKHLKKFVLENDRIEYPDCKQCK